MSNPTMPRQAPLLNPQESQKVGDQYAIEFTVKIFIEALSKNQDKREVGRVLYRCSRCPTAYLISELEKKYGVRRPSERDISEISKSFSSRLSGILKLF